MRTEVDEETKDLRDYLAALRRRKKPLLATVAVLFLIAVAVAALLPSSYRSTATILIEQQEMPRRPRTLHHLQLRGSAHPGDQPASHDSGQPDADR